MNLGAAVSGSPQRWSALKLLQLGDAVNAEGKGGSRGVLRLVEVAVCDVLHTVVIVLQIGGSGGGDLSAVDREGGGVEHVQGAVLDGAFHLGDLLFGAGSAGRAQSGDLDAVVSEAVAVVRLQPRLSATGAGRGFLGIQK